MIRKLKIPSVHWQEMQRHVAEQAPLEACGLLAGRNGFVEAVIRVTNAAQSPVKFRMAPQEQYDAFMWIEANDLDLVGLYHSHPAGPETASATDIAEAAYEVAHVIWSCADGIWSARGFWIENHKVATLSLLVKN